MNLPIDVRRAPYREKYLDEETPMLKRWMIFGHDPDDKTLQITDNNANDIFVGLSATQAARIIIARDEFVRKIIDIVNGDPSH